MIKQIVTCITVAGTLSTFAYEQSSKISVEVAAGVMSSSELDGFSVAEPTMTTTEVVEGEGSFIANVKVGYQWNKKSSIMGAYAVAGGYGNDVVTAYNAGVEGEYLFKTGKGLGAFSIGPYAGLGYYHRPDYKGSYGSYIDFDSTVGAYVGLKMMGGTSKVRLVGLLGYQYFAYDATATNGGTISDDTLDMSGFVAQLGFQF